MNIANNQYTKKRNEVTANLDECCGGCTCEANRNPDKARSKQTAHLTKTAPAPGESIR